MNRSKPGLPVHHQLPEFTQTHVHWVSDAIQPSNPLSSPSPPAPNPSQHQSLFQWVNSSHEVAKVLEFHLGLCISFFLLVYCHISFLPRRITTVINFIGLWQWVKSCLNTFPALLLTPQQIHEVVALWWPFTNEVTTVQRREMSTQAPTLGHLRAQLCEIGRASCRERVSPRV